MSLSDGCCAWIVFLIKIFSHCVSVNIEIRLFCAKLQTVAVNFLCAQRNTVHVVYSEQIKWILSMPNYVTDKKKTYINPR